MVVRKVVVGWEKHQVAEKEVGKQRWCTGLETGG